MTRKYKIAIDKLKKIVYHTLKKIEKGDKTLGKYSKYVKRENIRNTRKEKHISVKDLTKELGLSSTVSYYNIENGMVEPKISQMVTISKLLDEPVKNFFMLEPQENWDFII